jgi:hypothetical protein
MAQVKGGDGSSGVTPPEYGVWGDSHGHCGVVGTSDATGVAGISKNAVGVFGQSGRGEVTLAPLRPRSVGVEGESAVGVGVRGWAETGTGVEGTSSDGIGTTGTSAKNTGVFGRSSLPATPIPGTHDHYWDGGIGVFGENNEIGGRGVYGEANVDEGIGVFGKARGNYESIGVCGESKDGHGVWGSSDTSVGVYGCSSGDHSDSVGVVGQSSSGGQNLSGVRGLWV